MTGMERWRGKTALVTGASAGIGRAIALRLAAEGLRVMVAARREKALKTLQKEIQALGEQAMVCPVDLRDEAQIEAVFQAGRKEWGGVDVLINNAGVAWGGSVYNGKNQDWRDMLEVNVLALQICMREAMRDMKDKPFGHIINIGSLSSHRVNPNSGNMFYAGTKHAVRALTEGARQELVGRKSMVKVGMISPGTVATEIFDVGSRGKVSVEDRGYQPMTSEEIADLACYMLATPPHVLISDVIVRPIGAP